MTAAWASTPGVICEPVDEAAHAVLVEVLDDRALHYEERRHLDAQRGWIRTLLVSAERNTGVWRYLTSGEQSRFGCRPTVPVLDEAGAVPLPLDDVARRLSRAVAPTGAVDTTRLSARYRRHTRAGTMTVAVQQWPGGGHGALLDGGGSPLGEVLWCGGAQAPTREVLARLLPAAVWTYHLPAAAGRMPPLAAAALVPSSEGELVVVTVVEDDTTWRLVVDPLTYRVHSMTQTPAMNEVRFSYGDYRQTSAGLVLPHIVQVELLGGTEDRIELLQMDVDGDFRQSDAQTRCIRNFGLEP